MFKRLLAVVLLTGLVACAGSVVIVPQDSKLDATNSALLDIYRPSRFYDVANMNSPYIYVDGQAIGQLDNGSSMVRRIAPGKHRISTKRPWSNSFFKENKEEVSLEANFEKGKTYYLRYLADILEKDVTFPLIETQPTITLTLVSEKDWEAKE